MAQEALDSIAVGKLANEFRPQLFDVVHSLVYERPARFDSLTGKLSADYLLAWARGKHSIEPGQRREAWAAAPSGLQTRTYGQRQISNIESYGAAFVGVPLPSWDGGCGATVVGKTVFRSASEIDQDLKGLCRDVKRMIKEAIDNKGDRMVGARVAAYFKQNFVAIHPYMDANGRVAELIADRILKELGIRPPPRQALKYDLDLSIDEAARRMLG